MPLSLDGFEVLQRMAAQRDLFQFLKADTADAAERLLKKMLSSSSMDITTFRGLVKAVGEENIELVLQTMDVADVRALLERVAVSRMRSGPRRHNTATRRLLQAALERATTCETPHRKTLKTVLLPLENRPFSTLSMSHSLED